MLSLRLTFCLVLLAVVLAGCSSFAPDPPSATPVQSTKYFNQRLGIAAVLPGGNWNLDEDKSDAESENYLSINSDRTFILDIGRIKGPSPYEDVDLHTLLDKRLGQYRFATPTPFTTFHGYQATRLEGNPTSVPGFRYVEFYFINNGQLYWVSAAAPTGRWDIDGKKQVEQILDSVAVH
jgi:hypothetical protein